MTYKQQGIYILLLCHSWNKPLPNDKKILQKLCPGSRWEDIQKVLDIAFPLDTSSDTPAASQQHTNSKLAAIRQQVMDISEKRSYAAKCLHNNKTKDANAEQVQSKCTANQNHNQNHNQIESKDSTATRKKREPSTPKLSESEWMETLKANPAYKGIEVDREYHKCAAWCGTVNRKFTRRTFVNWLNRADKPLEGGQHAGPQTSGSGGRTKGDRNAEKLAAVRAELGIGGRSPRMAPVKDPGRVIDGRCEEVDDHAVASAGMEVNAVAK